MCSRNLWTTPLRSAARRDRGANPFDLSADADYPVSTDHKFTGNWIYDFPFGENHRFAQKGALAHILSNWQWSGDFTVAPACISRRAYSAAPWISLAASVVRSAPTSCRQPISLPNHPRSNGLTLPRSAFQVRAA